MTLMPGLRARWDEISVRERRLVLGAVALMLGALLWWVAVAPALATLRGAEGQHRLLDARLQQMLRLQAQAKALQAQPRMSYDDTRRAIEASVQSLGPVAQLTVAGDRATVTLKAIAPDAMAQWLMQARLNARVVPGEARLVRNATGNWDGTLVLSLGAQ